MGVSATLYADFQAKEESYDLIHEERHSTEHS